MTATTMMEHARAFLGAKRVALVGLERDERGFSRLVFKALLERGYDVVPVNPAMTEAQGRRCYPRVQDIQPPVEAALIMTPSARTAEVVRDCLATGVRRLWLHRGAGAGSSSPEALTLCREGGVQPVTDLCPFMAFPDPGWLHAAHRFLRGGGTQLLR
jgi:predicted CoA-binding protein